MSQTKFKVAGMISENCADSVVGALRSIGAEGHVDLAGQTVTVQYDERKISVDNLKNALQEQGFQLRQ